VGAEYELKYRANEACQAAIAADFSGGRESVAMQTTYYDTPSGSLSANRYMLRKRLENGVSVCTLKTSGKGNLRGEWEAESHTIASTVPMLCKLGCPGDLAELCAEGLVPICGASFTRWAKLLTFPDFTAELALDRGILFSGEKECPLCEIELELKAGSKDGLDAFATDFAVKYDLLPEEKSKFARALSLYKEV